MAVRDGRILICDTGRRAIVQADPRAGGLRPVELRGLTGDLDPVAIATDSRGDVYIADAAGKRVLRMDSANTVLRTYSLPPDEPFLPIDVAIAADRLYVVNRAARCVNVFDPSSGGSLGTFAEEGENRAVFPVAVALNAKGQVYVADMVSSRVRVYDPDGKAVRQIGGPGDRPGLFAQPRSVAVGPDGITYVSDAATHIVQMFDETGELLMYFGESDGSIGQLGMPGKILVVPELVEAFQSQTPAGFASRYVILVADQAPPGRIGVYAFGQLAQAVEVTQP